MLTDEQIEEIKTLLPDMGTSLEFPTTADKGFDKFTTANKEIAINVYELECNSVPLGREHFNVVPLRHKKAHFDRKCKINLLFIQDGKNAHYCLIKDFNGFITGNDKNRNHIIACERCVSYTTTSQNDYLKHIETCSNNAPCKLIMPTEENNTWKFTMPEMMSSPLACGYADLEASNTALIKDIGTQTDFENYESSNASEFIVTEDNVASTRTRNGITIITLKDTPSEHVGTEVSKKVKHQRKEIEQNPNSYGLLITSKHQHILEDEFIIQHAKTMSHKKLQKDLQMK